MTHLEIEVKFPIQNLQTIETRLQGLEARLLRPRLHEVNLRFDTSTGELGSQNQVLRLRQGDDIRLTFKGPTDARSGIAEREEIEFTVGDFETAWKFLEALGFGVVVIYEKYRTAYQLGHAEILLDETPIGNFIEIEAPSQEQIRVAAAQLGLDWDSRLTRSYLGLFERLREKQGFTFRDMTFENFS
jgi:adenylate cyclase class 2